MSIENSLRRLKYLIYDYWKKSAFFKIYYSSYSSYAIFTVGIISTFLVTNYFLHQVNDQDLLRFNNEIDKITENIDKPVANNITILRSVAGLFAASDSVVTRNQFRLFVERLRMQENYPDILGVGYSEIIPAHLKTFMEEYARLQGLSKFKIWPDTERSEYHAIFYIEPLNNRNLAALGYDMFTDPVRRSAMEKARDTGSWVISGKVTLVQEIGQNKQPGFLMYVPVYRGDIPSIEADRRKNIIGFTYSPLRAGDFFNSIFKEGSYPEIQFKIYDGSIISDDYLLYTSRNFNAETNLDSTFVEVRSYEDYKYPWTIVFSTTSAFNEASRKKFIPLTVIGGVVFTLGLYIITRQQFRSQLNIQKKKDEFIGVVSHELKTPVTSVKAFAQMLSRRFLAKGDVQSADLLKKMDKELSKLTLLISDLLDVTKIEGGKMFFNKVEFKFDKLMVETVEQLQRTVEKHRLILEEGYKGVIFGDKDRIVQTITNLVTNAVKYSPNSDKVIIKTEALNQSVKISVQDFGIGISKQNQQLIFDRYYRVDHSRSLNRQGVGLGLYISAEIARRHGGSISVQSEEGKGSIFSLILPISLIDNKTNNLKLTSKRA